MKLLFPLFAPEGDAPAAGGGVGGSTILSAASSVGSSQHQEAQPSQGSAGASTPAAGGQAWTWAKEDGSFSEDWADRLPDGLKGNPSLKTISTLPDLAKAFVETKGLVGKKLEMPGEGATPEQISTWRKTVGAPDKPEGYRGDAKTLRPDSLPEDAWSMDAENKFLAIAHKHHLPPAAVKEIMGFYGGSLVDTMKQGQAEQDAMVVSETGKLRETWGKDFDGNLADAARMATIAGLDPKNDPIFTNARAVEAFAKMAKLISGDKLITGEQPSLSASVRDRINDITDPKSQSMLAREYRGEFGPGRQQTAQTQLHQMMSSQAQK
jgi:hypothetical protein